MRARVGELRDRCHHRLRSPQTVLLYVAEAPGRCPRCGGPMLVQKTAARTGRTLAHGPFDARETVHVCAAGCRWPSGARVTRRAACLSEALIPLATVGYDVLVFVGLQRFLHQQQREEIQAALLDRGVRISTGEVSEMSRRFTRYVARLHHARSKELRAAIEDDGGWPLHVDATGEAGRGTLLLAMAGWRRWVLGAWKISTERADLILPCLRQTVRRFGPPCAAMRDLGRAMIPALNDLISELKLEIPVLACHQHFLADVGKDLLEPAQAQLRELFQRAKVRPKLRALVRDLGRRIGKDIEQAREAVQKWQLLNEAGRQIDPGLDGLAVVRALAQWTLDYKAQATGFDFPFDRPYLDLNDRCRTALRAANAFLRNPPKDKQVTTALERLHRTLEPISAQVPFRQVAVRLRRRAALFDELRRVLRLTASPPETETSHDLEQMRRQLDVWVASLRERRPARGPAQDTREAIVVILRHIATHGPTLWGHAIRLPERVGGGIRLVARTNYLAENFFGELKHDERRRSGHKNLGHDLELLPAEAALVRNLEHDDYVTIVCGSLDRLAKAFAELDRDERQRRLNGVSVEEQDDDLESILQIESASLSPADRRVVRTEEMVRRVAAAARSRAPRSHC
jgi:hypothetical protein